MPRHYISPRTFICSRCLMHALGNGKILQAKTLRCARKTRYMWMFQCISYFAATDILVSMGIKQVTIKRKYHHNWRIYMSIDGGIVRCDWLQYNWDRLADRSPTTAWRQYFRGRLVTLAVLPEAAHAVRERGDGTTTTRESTFGSQMSVLM